MPTWQKLGLVAPPDSDMTANEAFETAGLNFKYHSLPVGVTLPSGEFVQTERDLAVYREPTAADPSWRSLGIVSKGYTYLQNHELASGIDAIAEQTGWKFDSAGAIGEGGTVFVCLKTGKHSIHGDEVDSYFLVTDGKAANRALSISVMTLRLVCVNGLKIAEKDSVLSITVPHSVGVDNEYRFWLDMISSLEKAQEEAFTDLRRMGDTRISDAEAQNIFLSAFPEPAQNQRVKLSKAIPDMKIAEGKKADAATALSAAVQAYEYNMAQSVKWREASTELYERFNQGKEQGGSMSGAALVKLKGTAYAALQAVTEICDWGGTNRDSVAGATLFGGRAAQKSRAWTAALQLADRV